MWRIRQLIISIKNLIYYFKVVWSDRDWDYSFINYILLAKLKKMLERYESYEYVLDHEKDMTQPLRICVEILQREENDFYLQTINGLKRPDEGYACYSDVREGETTRLLFRIMGKYLRYWWD